MLLYHLHRLLAALFSTKLNVEQKLDILESEYHIPGNHEIREEVKKDIKQKSVANRLIARIN